VVVEPFRGFRELICTIPGISTLVADVITAETGADMTRFPTASPLASWAGTCPGSNESAGRVKSTKTRPGNPYLKGALGVAAMSAARGKNTYLSVKYRRIASRRGPMKAIVAIEHAMLTAIWNMATTGALYDDPGSDFYTRRNPQQSQTPRHRTTPRHGLQRHPRTDRVTKEPLTQGNLRVRGPLGHAWCR
jgi:transposase